MKLSFMLLHCLWWLISWCSHSYRVISTHTILDFNVDCKIVTNFKAFLSKANQTQINDKLHGCGCLYPYVSVELIGKTPVKFKPTPPSLRSVSQDVIKHLGIVTVNEGQVDAATLNSSNTVYCTTAYQVRLKLSVYWFFLLDHKEVW